MKLKQLLFIAVGALLAIPAFCTPIVLGIAGDAQVGSTFVNFGDLLGTTYTPAPGYGAFLVAQPPTDIFATAGVMAGETGTIQSISSALTPPGTIVSPTNPFMTFNTGGSSLKIYMTELASPFPNLTETVNGAVAAFNFNGYVLDASTKLEEAVTGTFSATFDGLTPAQVLAANGTDTPFSGTLSVTAAPEPTSILLTGTTLALAGMFYRRRLLKK